MGEEAFGVLKILYQYYFFLKLRRAQLADAADKYLRLRLHTDSANFQYYVRTVTASQWRKIKQILYFKHFSSYPMALLNIWNITGQPLIFSLSLTACFRELR